MKKLSFACILTGFFLSVVAQSPVTPYESSGKLASATYQEAISFYAALADEYAEVSMREYGRSDAGLPIHLITICREGEFDRKHDDRVFLLINNGIHPGEPCGIDACMMMVRDLMEKPEYSSLLDRLVLGIIPVYNIGGSLNRSCCTRANQVGPVEQGFRGNARNYDLNRDFMKMDSHNARAFAEIYQDFMPHIFLDTHTTNGADYQAPLTYIATLSNKLTPRVASYQDEVWMPAMLERAEANDLLLSPYVNKFDGPPEEGMAAFLDLPRYASGYAALFQTMAFISEAHMLKTFEERVEATYAFIRIMLELANEQAPEIVEAVSKGQIDAARQRDHDVAWELDTTREETVIFHGYESEYRPGAVTGQPRLFYDRSKPYSLAIPYFPHYSPTTTISSPNAYIIPQAWTEVIDRLRWNGVELQPLAVDTVLEVEVYYVETPPMTGQPYEGHYFHQEVTTRMETQSISFRKGDVVVKCAQVRRPFLVHALEPDAQDSWFRWNFFDPILMQKEYFSPYLFEELAADILAKDAALKKEFEEKKANEPAFASNANWQLFYIYQRSAYYEPTHKRYPVVRWLGGKLPVE